ncbi:type VI secretion IcmF C-terminal domain-containing protein [Hahella aquimaris]|nr:type VI secretion IcmF C-terminal domain-containing protein [Hahella sp. HNIBRBA332]WLQ17447.1 type VI secretion IcmF C-terminal domain-containing protein [Hahella sp. HNIBRBA332]
MEALSASPIASPTAVSSENAPKAGFRVSLRPLTMPPSIRRIHMVIGEIEAASVLGPRFWSEFSWPASHPDAYVEVETLNGDRKRFDFLGEWALFRFLEQARITPESATSGQAQFDFGGLQVTYQIKTATAAQFSVLQNLSNYPCSESIP